MVFGATVNDVCTQVWLGTESVRLYENVCSVSVYEILFICQSDVILEDNWFHNFLILYTFLQDTVYVLCSVYRALE